MKTIPILFLLCSVGFSQELDSSAIDKRLEELKTIWNQEQAVINGFTKNRTVPVKEGSKEYYACVQAAKRIKQAEEEAAKLKEKKEELKSEKPKVESIASIDNISPSKIPFDFEETKKKADEKKSLTLVFKGFYLDMPASDALGLINHYLGRDQVSDSPVAITTQQIQQRLRESTSEAIKEVLGEGKRTSKSYRIYQMDEKRFIASSDSLDVPIAFLDENLKVVEFRFSKEVCDKLFDSAKTPIREFVETFISSYGVPSLERDSLTLNTYTSEVGAQHYYSHRSPKGYELTIWDDRSVFSSDPQTLVLLGGQGAPQGSVFLKKIQTANERKSKFD